MGNLDTFEIWTPCLCLTGGENSDCTVEREDTSKSNLRPDPEFNRQSAYRNVPAPDMWSPRYRTDLCLPAYSTLPGELGHPSI
jgi:hypothetical protein